MISLKSLDEGWQKMVDHTTENWLNKSLFPKLQMRRLHPTAACLWLIFLFCWFTNISESYEAEATSNSRNQKLIFNNNSEHNAVHIGDSESYLPSKLFKNYFKTSGRNKRETSNRSGKCKWSWPDLTNHTFQNVSTNSIISSLQSHVLSILQCSLSDVRWPILADNWQCNVKPQLDIRDHSQHTFSTL